MSAWVLPENPNQNLRPTPGDDIDRASKDQHVQEEESHCGRRGCLFTGAEQGCQEHHAERKTGTTPDHGPSATNAVKSERRKKVTNGEHPVGGQ